jgi:hypothetical protein
MKPPVKSVGWPTVSFTPFFKLHISEPIVAFKFYKMRNAIRTRTTLPAITAGQSAHTTHQRILKFSHSFLYWWVWFKIFCGSTWVRTRNLSIMSRLLTNQLSYRPAKEPFLICFISASLMIFNFLGNWSHFALSRSVSYPLTSTNKSNDSI